MAAERYQRQRLLGQGLMSEIWLAHDIYTQEPVALKLMIAIPEDDRRNQKAFERFHREIAIASSLKHPHILPVLNYGYMEYKGRSIPFLVSPYVQDGSLADLIKNTPPWKCWTLAQTADAIIQAAESLYYLHTREPQIIHQDVKPGNFLVRSVQGPGRIAHLYLCDFGISRWRRASTSMASELIGTFAYMAPEQVERKVDPASDQYALAIMACYLLTGKLPLQASTNEQYAEAHLHEQPRLPSQLNPERISTPEIDAIFARALTKHPQQRFPTIMAFAHSLEQAIMKQIEAQAVARTEWFSHLAVEEPATQGKKASSKASSLLATPGIPIAIDLPDFNEDRILDEPLPPKPLRAVTSVAGNGGIGDIALPLQVLREYARYTLSARPKTLCWSPDSAMLAAVLYGSDPVLLYKDGRSQEVCTPEARRASCVSWSPDGRFLAVSASGTIHFWDTLRQTALPLVLLCQARAVDGLDWSGDGRLAVWVENQIRLYDLPSRGLLTMLSAHPAQILPTGKMLCGNIGVLRWSPDGTQLVAGASNGELRCWDIGYQTAVWQVVGPGQKVNNLAWSPDGKLLAVAFRDNRVEGWDTHGRSRIFCWEKLPAMPRMVSVSPEQRIVVASAEKYLLLGSSNGAFPSAVLPGQLLASCSPTGPELATLDEHSETALIIWM
ncbi:MAG TPA: serine/threonine-protein kinase [Ktedonosporobacter sp.]|jgi:serine/threonine protein kinase|nr:serine/threonine-protein kinase [Ktedonosporobacter sp.]